MKTRVVGTSCCGLGRRWRAVSAIVILVTSQSVTGSDRFVPKEVLPYGIHDVGGCKIISIRPSEEPSAWVRRRCRELPKPGKRLGKTWHDHYSSIELTLGDALDLAEKHVGGYRYSLLERNTQLVVYSEPYPNAMVYRSDAEIVFLINDGLVDLIEGTVSGLGMKRIPFQEEAYGGILGVGFDEWLEAMRTPRWLWGDRPIGVGPEHIEVPGFGAGWFFHTRPEAMALYQYVFAHEMAHLKAGDRFEDSSPMLETERDLDALRASKNAKLEGYADVAAIYVGSLLLAMSYYEKYWEPEIRKAGYRRFDGARDVLHARDWHRRGLAILEAWDSMEPGVSAEAKGAVHDWLLQLYMLRSPIAENPSTRELAKRLEVERIGRFSEFEANDTVGYRYRLVNGNDNRVRITAEVQSRVYPRDTQIPFSIWAPRDHEENAPYGVVDDSVHEVVLGAGESSVIAGRLSGLSTEDIYGRLKLRFVSVSPEH